MRKKFINKYLMLLTLLFFFSACSLSNESLSLDEIKSDLNCFTYEDGMRWQIIKEEFGEPDLAPLPSGKGLSRNTRVYEDKVVIFHTELNKIKVDGKTRYEEIISRVEICKHK
ncbi:MAG: hypothetical protein PVH57_13155 [Syntrophobacterales bacterium]